MLILLHTDSLSCQPCIRPLSNLSLSNQQSSTIKPAIINGSLSNLQWNIGQSTTISSAISNSQLSNLQPSAQKSALVSSAISNGQLSNLQRTGQHLYHLSFASQLLLLLVYSLCDKSPLFLTPEHHVQLLHLNVNNLVKCDYFPLRSSSESSTPLYPR